MGKKTILQMSLDQEFLKWAKQHSPITKEKY